MLPYFQGESRMPDEDEEGSGLVNGELEPLPPPGAPGRPPLWPLPQPLLPEPGSTGLPEYAIACFGESNRTAAAAVKAVYLPAFFNASFRVIPLSGISILSVFIS